MMLPVFEIPPPIELLSMKIPAAVPLMFSPGVTVPAFVTAPATVAPTTVIEVVTCPTGLLVIVCPARATGTAPRTRAESEVAVRRPDRRLTRTMGLAALSLPEAWLRELRPT